MTVLDKSLHSRTNCRSNRFKANEY
uniref:Uncharacterized protein n=1 Tax=Anguilla anguilla TaxID=7936 RepID=A0A0E9VYU0_ANGAN